MNTKYIARVQVNAFEGGYGQGATIEEAKSRALTILPAKYRKRKNLEWVVTQFTSELPFAPNDRDATSEECDAWCGTDGSLNWLRCEKQTISQ